MTISELIEILSSAKKERGDLAVWFSVVDEEGAFCESQFLESETSWGKLFVWSALDIRVKGEKLLFCQYPPFKNQMGMIRPEKNSLIYDKRNEGVMREVEQFYSDATVAIRSWINSKAKG